MPSFRLLTRQIGLRRPTLQCLPRRSPILRQQFSAYRTTSRNISAPEAIEPKEHVQNKGWEHYQSGYHEGFANGERRGRWHGLGITAAATAASAALWYHYRPQDKELEELRKEVEELRKNPEGKVEGGYGLSLLLFILILLYLL